MLLYGVGLFVNEGLQLDQSLRVSVWHIEGLIHSEMNAYVLDDSRGLRSRITDM